MCEGDGTDPKQGDEGDLGVGGGGEDENAVQQQAEYRQVDEDFRPVFFKGLDECLHTIEYSRFGTLMQFHGAGSAKTPRL